MNVPVVEESYPLSPLQQGMLFHTLSAPGSGVDIEQMVCTLREPIEPGTLRAAWAQIVQRHAVLRTAFRWEEEPVQEVFSQIEVPWSEHDFSELEPDPQTERLGAFLRTDRARGFDLARPPLLRLTLLRFGGADFRLVWTFHHALLDGRSFPIVLREVFAWYDARRAGTDLVLPEPRRYREYIEWLQSNPRSGSENYWRELLAGFLSPTRLVVEGLGLEDDGCSGQGDRECRVALFTTSALHELANANGFTLNTIVQGAWAILLSRYSREEDVVFGATRACRKSSVPGADEMVGLFINTLPIRVRITPGTQLVPWLKELRAQWVAMREHEHTPLANVQASSDVPAGRALFDSIVVFENYELNDLLRTTIASGETRNFRLYEQTSFALTLAAYDSPELLLRVEFDRARFAVAAIDRLLGHLRTLLESIASQPAAQIDQLLLITSAERAELVFDRHPRRETEMVSTTLHELTSFC